MVQMEQDRELERQKVAQHRDVLVTTWQSQVQLREAEAVEFPPPPLSALLGFKVWGLFGPSEGLGFMA